MKSQVDFIQSVQVQGAAKPTSSCTSTAASRGPSAPASRRARLYNNGHRTEWIGLDKVPGIDYRQKRDESTRCYFCKNKCLRTFIDVDIELQNTEAEERMARRGSSSRSRRRPKSTRSHRGTKRLIIATCEKGEVEDVESMRKIKGGLDEIKKDYPNYAAQAAKDVWRRAEARESVADDPDEAESGLGSGGDEELPPVDLAQHSLSAR